MALDKASTVGYWGEQARLLLFKAKWCDKGGDVACRNRAVNEAEAIYAQLRNDDMVGRLRAYREEEGISNRIAY